MNTDFRIKVSLPTHPKTLKLMRRCGDIAFYNLVKFWSYVAQNKPSGVLKGLDIDDIEIASGWTGQCSEYAQALLDLHFIDEVDGVYVVHDWEDHNGYACHAENRSLKAKKAAEARWNKKNDATSNAQAMLPDATSNAPAPAPTPTPINKPSKRKVPKPPKSIEEFIDYFKENGRSEKLAKNAYHYYDAAGWRDSQGKPVLCWKQKVRAVWFPNEKPEPKSEFVA